MQRCGPFVGLAAALGALACGDDSGDGPVLDAGLALDAGGAMLEASTPDAAGIDAANGDASDGRAAVTLRFRAKVGTADLVCSETYADLGTTRLRAKPQDFRFVVQDVRLLTRAGAEVPLEFDERPPFQSKEVVLLDFTDGTGSCSVGGAQTNMVITGRVPPGDYVGLVFSNGVPEALNHADPFYAPAPLQAPGLSWDWLQGYRFLLAELNVPPGQSATMLDAGSTDAGAAGGDAGAASAGSGHGGGGGHQAPQVGLAAVHLGSTACTGGVGVGISCAKKNRTQVRLTGFDPTVGTVIADLAEVFAGVDLGQDAVCHSRGAQCGPMFSALGVDLETGAPLATQRVFRVE